MKLWRRGKVGGCRAVVGDARGFCSVSGGRLPPPPSYSIGRGEIANSSAEQYWTKIHPSICRIFSTKNVYFPVLRESFFKYLVNSGKYCGISYFFHRLPRSRRMEHPVQFSPFIPLSPSPPSLLLSSPLFFSYIVCGSGCVVEGGEG